jgi:hypothetical protein
MLIVRVADAGHPFLPHHGAFKRGADPSSYSSPSQTRTKTDWKKRLFEKGIKGVSK